MSKGTYHREDETRRLIENWHRWAGHTLGSPTSRSLSEAVLQRQEAWRNEAPLASVIAVDAEHTESAIKALGLKQRQAIVTYYLKTSSLKQIAALICCGETHARVLLHMAHSDFWEAFEASTIKAQSLRNRAAMTNDLSKVVPGVGSKRPKPEHGPVVVLSRITK